MGGRSSRQRLSSLARVELNFELNLTTAANYWHRTRPGNDYGVINDYARKLDRREPEGTRAFSY